MSLDARAVKILSSMFWSPAGWRDNPTVSPEDFAYAKAKGIMFEPVALSHDDAASAAVTAVRQVDRDTASRAFVASLSSRRLDLRSALGSYAVGRHLQPHRKLTRDGHTGCAYCGEYDSAPYPNILNFERIKWGGVRHDNPRYIALDLTELKCSDATPTTDDYQILRGILETANSMNPKARLKDLARAISTLLPSNDAERRTLLGILGYAGILSDGLHPDFRAEFVPVSDRERTHWHTDDWPYPVQWWSGACGINASAVAEWFPDI